MKRVALLLCLSPFAFAQDIELPDTLSNNSVADADEVMANFNALKDGFNSRVRISLEDANVAVGDGLEKIVLWDGINGNDYDDGRENTAVGFYTLYANTTGAYNTAVGAYALSSNTEGGANTAIGRLTLRNNTQGQQNVAIGDTAMMRNKTGSTNTAVGIAALSYNTEGRSNVALGGAALGQNTTGFLNTAVGNQALNRNISGFNNTAVGYWADVTADDLQNSTVIGYFARVEASNTIQLGNGDITDVYLGKRDGGTGEANANLHLQGKIISGAVTYPNTHGTNGQVLGTTGSGELVWLNSSQIVASRTQELEEQVASLQEQLQSQQQELLAIVQSQQEQIAQLQRMVEHQFAVN